MSTHYDPLATIRRQLGHDEEITSEDVTIRMVKDARARLRAERCREVASEDSYQGKYELPVQRDDIDERAPWWLGVAIILGAAAVSALLARVVLVPFYTGWVEWFSKAVGK